MLFNGPIGTEAAVQQLVGVAESLVFEDEQKWTVFRDTQIAFIKMFDSGFWDNTMFKKLETSSALLECYSQLVRHFVPHADNVNPSKHEVLVCLPSRRQLEFAAPRSE